MAAGIEMDALKGFGMEIHFIHSFIHTDPEVAGAVFRQTHYHVVTQAVGVIFIVGKMPAFAALGIQQIQAVVGRHPHVRSVFLQHVGYEGVTQAVRHTDIVAEKLDVEEGWAVRREAYFFQANAGANPEHIRIEAGRQYFVDKIMRQESLAGNSFWRQVVANEILFASVAHQAVQALLCSDPQ